MRIGIIGLGLIGGSLAKAYKAAGETVLGFDKDESITDFVLLSKAIDEKLTEENLKTCDFIFLAVTPKAAIDWLQSHAKELRKEQIVIDCCGTKRKVCEVGFSLARNFGFTFLGGHPMAGLQKGGFKNSSEALFKGALFALVPPDFKDVFLLERVKNALLPAGFQRVTCITAEQHDKAIAFTSQMAHVVSNAFIKSETARTIGTAVSAGSYRDFTRVAYLDADMWTELFLENKDNLIYEIDTLCEALKLYRDALEQTDAKTLHTLLEEGKQRKMEVENRCD